MKSTEPQNASDLYSTYLRTFVLAKLGRELPNTTFLYRQDSPLSQAELAAIALAADDAGSRGVAAQAELLSRIQALLGGADGESDPIALVA